MSKSISLLAALFAASCAMNPMTTSNTPLTLTLGTATPGGGFPVYGDEKYGSRFRFGNGIGLHAHALTFLHPIRYDPIALIAEPPKRWRGTFAYLLKT